MEYRRLGTSGLQVSRIVLGCMGFGDGSLGTHPWAVGIDEARPLFRQALDAGITAFDTANVYSLGVSEEIVGALVAEVGVREQVVIMTKVFSRMGTGPKDAGLSRASLFTQVDASLRRLRTDYIDLYQIHRYDPETPIEETMAALNDMVRAGKVRYIGASSMWTWQFAKAQYTADLHGWTRFASMQDQYNLLMREEEREMLPFCLDQGIGVLPWSPLARGQLARPWNDKLTARSTNENAFGASLYRQDPESDRFIVDSVGAIAQERGVTRAQVALAWLMQKPVITAPIVGATKPQHLSDAVAAASLTLSADEVKRLEVSYTPRNAEGF
ncbi:aldo/keto reductase [Mycobacterium simiae]|uniref:Aldo/keto reductase n=1 Tax=Mycobacterium simiae TaxID=1784 RepID=A0A5B1BRA2_MYCSI|nr:aldo/keto reductase [Mycobacterium simiae]KAA1249950.1 aldo/keto reductase [Mycobacterium simiae]